MNEVRCDDDGRPALVEAAFFAPRTEKERAPYLRSERPPLRARGLLAAQSGSAVGNEEGAEAVDAEGVAVEGVAVEGVAVEGVAVEALKVSLTRLLAMYCGCGTPFSVSQYSCRRWNACSSKAFSRPWRLICRASA